MNFTRTRACNTCPFRRDGCGNPIRGLGSDTAREIADTLEHNDSTFSCHDDNDLPQSKRNHCVGAMHVIEANDNPNQMMRICERLGIYDRRELTGAEDCFDNMEEFVISQHVETVRAANPPPNYEIRGLG